jgi:hypothetical protein
VLTIENALDNTEKKLYNKNTRGRTITNGCYPYLKTFYIIKITALW